MLSPVEFRTCLFHPKIRAVWWSGHVHIDSSLGDLHVIVGFCKSCHKWEEQQYKNNGLTLASSKNCVGCYGNYREELR